MVRPMVSACLRRVRERRLAVDADQDREPLLPGAHRAHRVEPVVLAGEGDLLAVEKPPQDDDGLGEARLPDRRRVERDADRLILGERVPGADAELDAASGEMVERRDLASEVHRMTEVVVEHQRADANALRRLPRRLSSGASGGPHVADVVRGVDDVEAGRFRRARTRTQFGGGRQRRELVSEAKLPHRPAS